MIKCVYKQDHFSAEPHCNKEVDYIFLGKSYCKEHFGVRSDEMKKLMQDKKDETGSD